MFQSNLVTQLKALTKTLTKNFNLHAKIDSKKQFRKTLQMYFWDFKKSVCKV